NFFCTVSYFFWKQHIAGINALECERVFLPVYLKDCLQPKSPVTWINPLEHKHYSRLESNRPWFFSERPEKYISLGGSVVFVCLHILFHLGFEEVVLLGVDQDYGLEKQQTEAKSGIMIDSKELNAHFIPDYYPNDDKVHIDLVAAERGYQL